MPKSHIQVQGQGLHYILLKIMLEITKKLGAFSQTLLSYKITQHEGLPKLPFLLVGENFSSESLQM
jgi:hypothetical protein